MNFIHNSGTLAALRDKRKGLRLRSDKSDLLIFLLHFFYSAPFFGAFFGLMVHRFDGTAKLGEGGRECVV